MHLLLIGKNGQVGWELQRTLAPLGEVVSLDYPDIDLADIDALRGLVRQVKPQVIVNAAAYTAVDQAESETELAWAINALAPGVLGEEARALRAILVHFSSDYVFDGQIDRPYRESDAPKPISAYGRSKLGGEAAVREAGGVSLVFRTSWVYSLRKGGFVNKVLEWARQQRVMRVVADQIASPTWCRMLAEATAQVLAMGGKDLYSWVAARQGLYHLAGSGYASRLEWAQAILQLDPQKDEQVVEDVQPALTAEFPSPAARPLYSALDCSLFSTTFGLSLPDWELALALAMNGGC
jgi:dTDP-4-dehydrorhamnose reductase